MLTERFVDSSLGTALTVRTALQMLPEPSDSLTEPIEQIDRSQEDEYPKAPWALLGRLGILLGQEGRIAH